jgi:two-component system sensor histidine kinase UhpB
MPGKHKGTAIETQRPGRRRAEHLALVAYPLAWALLYGASDSYWFLPAGLRLGALLLLPRRSWWKLAIAEWTGLLAILLALGTFDHPLAMTLSTVLPWCVYAAVFGLAHLPMSSALTPPVLARLLGASVVAALLNGMVLSAVAWIERGHQAATLVAMVFRWSLGDFSGILTIAPLLLLAREQARGPREPWQRLAGRGLVLLPVGTFLVVSTLPMLGAAAYPAILALLPMFLVAFQFGWKPGAIALALLSVGMQLKRHVVLENWSPGQAQVLIATLGSATLLLGIASDALRSQGRALASAVQILSSRSRDLTDIAGRISTQQEDERRRIGAELHDQLGQDMTAIATRVHLARRGTDDAAVLGSLDAIAALVQDAHLHLRDVIDHLHPVALSRFGLRRALEDGPVAELARDNGIDYRCDADALEGVQLPPAMEIAMYRICQEATSNAVRHGCGGFLRIGVRVLRGADADTLLLRIDDKAGAIAVADGHGHGLQIIRDRAHALGADYTFDPASGRPRHWLQAQLPREPA